MTELSSGWPRAAQRPRVKIPLPRSCLCRPTEYTCQVRSTSAERSQTLKALENVDTAWMDIRPVLEVIFGKMTKNVTLLAEVTQTSHFQSAVDGGRNKTNKRSKYFDKKCLTEGPFPG